MHVYMHVCMNFKCFVCVMYACLCVADWHGCMYVCLHVNMYVCIYVQTDIHEHLCALMYVCIHVFRKTDKHESLLVCISHA